MNTQIYSEKKKIICRDDYPLSHGQSSLWFFYQLVPNSAAYNIGFKTQISYQIDTEVLRRALQSLLERHPILRTTFSDYKGEPRQIIHEHQELILDIHNVASCHEWEIEERINQDYKRPFNLENEPVIRASLYSIHNQNHILLITLHHIVSDAWSGKLLLDELQILYFSYLANKSPKLASPTISYIDYISYQKHLIFSDEGDKHWQYWRDSLADELPILSLPTDHPRPHSSTHKLATHRLQCSEILTQQLQQLARSERATPYMLFMATFQVLLSRYTAQEDIIVGSPMKCRNQKDFWGVVGYFVNPVAIRGDLSNNPEFSLFLRQIRKKTLEAISHQDYPFSLLVERLQPNRDKSHPPIFQTLLVWQKYQEFATVIDLLSEVEDDKNNSKRWDLKASKMPEQESEFDLILEVLETNENLLIDFKYNSLLFEPDTIARMERHFLTLLSGIIHDPHQPINQPPILSAPEYNQILNDWNTTDTDYSPEKCFQELFDEQVERNPQAIALRFQDRCLTYRELAERANQLAHYLQELGVKPEVLVGLCLERSPEMVIGLLAILKAGGAYVPLDPSYPKDRLEYMLVDAQIPLLITSSHLIPRIPTSPTTVICLDQVQEEIAQRPITKPNSLVKLDNLVYIIYTSGSTGKPKGVQIQHRGLYNLAKAQIQHFNVQSNSKILQFASLCFDASISEIAMTLGAGACLCLAPQESLLPGSPLEQTLTTYQITHITLPPSALSVMQPDNLPTLEAIVVAGEACPEEIARQWSSSYRFFNAYGPTESTVCTTIAEYNPLLGKPPIGKPIANLQVYVLDKYLQPVPIGIPGELHIGGVGLARGYLNRPDLTAEKFIPNPFTDNPHSRLYKTGDLVRYLPDGNLEFLGRIDTQIKLRGYRLEIGEIEAVLHKQAEVREAAVIVKEGNAGNKSLIAYIVRRSQDLTKSEEAPAFQAGVSLTISQLRDFLKTQLPDYMIPSALIFLEAMPLNPNGKIDRRALAQMDISRASRSEQEFLSPQTPTEITLAKLWREVLEIENIGREDNFFELGGHSLLAMKLISRINTELSLDLPLRSLFEAPTIAELAVIITNPTTSISDDRMLGREPNNLDVLDQKPYVHIPDTVSPQAREFFQTLKAPSLLPRFPDPEDFAGWQKLQAFAEADGKAKAEFLLQQYKYTLIERTLGDVPCLDIRPQHWQDNGKLVIYIHGGSHVMYSAYSTLDKAVVTAEETGLRIISVDYTLAPLAKYNQMSDEVIAAIQALLPEGQRLENMAIYGDSSGGGLAAAVVLKMRDRGLGMPKAVVLVSPWLDVTPSGDTEYTLCEADPNGLYESHGQYAAAAYAHPQDQKHPYASPVYGDYSQGFPATLIQGGLKEVLLSGFVRLYQALDAAGQTVKLDLYEGMIHNFQYRIPDAPEAILARQKIVRFLEQHLGK